MAERPNIFIEPSCIEIDSINDNLSDLVISYDHEIRKVNHDQFLNEKFAVVVASPGAGKTRFLIELVNKSFSNKISAFYINLKSIGSHSIENFIKKNIENYTPQIASSNSEINSVRSFFASNSLFSSEALICLDALDEVKTDPLLLIETIRNFHKAFPESRILLTCRDYIFKRFQHLFLYTNPKLFRLTPLNYNDIRSYLSKNNISETNIDVIISRFSVRGNITLINSPRILEVLCELIDRSGDIKDVLLKSKSELIESFIYSELKSEDEKTLANKAPFLKRVLECLALNMEIYQQNRITNDELLSFFSDIHNQLSISLLNQVPLEDFCERYLQQSDYNHLEFQNSEFQEFLAAKELSRFSNKEQVIFDIIFDNELLEFYPSWSNTLKYLIYFDVNLLPVLVDFISKRNSLSDAYLIPIIFSETDTVIDKLSIEQKNDIFKKIYSFYINNNAWFNWDLAERIVDYIPIDFENTLLIDFEKILTEAQITDEFVSNVFGVIRGGIIKNKINRDNWKNKLLNAVNFSSKVTLSVFNVIDAFEDIYVFKQINAADFDNDVLYEYLFSCNNIGESAQTGPLVPR